MLQKYFKNLIFSLPFLKSIFLKYRIKQGVLLKYNSIYLDDADIVLLDSTINNDLHVGLVKDGILYDDDAYLSSRADFIKYERFLINNKISYSYYNIDYSTWLEDAEQFDVIIWRSSSDPATQQMAKNKIYFLEKIAKKRCFPSFDELWPYEEKINIHYIYKYFKLPEIYSFVSFSKLESLNYINKCQFPIISKISTGSASQGVEILHNKRQAKKVINKVFSNQGKRTYWYYLNQKDYVYFQKYINDATYDLRIIVIGNKLFGYYRYAKKGDFRASGSGIVEKKEIPREALELAYLVKNVFNTSFLATDLLYSKSMKKYLIIESSIFIGIDTCEQLVINGISGYYERVSEENYLFKPGKYWIQELALKEFFDSNSRLL